MKPYVETEDGRARDKTASDDRPQTPVAASSSPTEQADRSGGQQPVSSGVKRNARAAELPDEDEQGGKFQQVEGLTTVDAEVISCEFSVEDDFMIDENTEGVTEEIVKAIVAGKKKELDAMEAFGIYDVCEELPRDAKVITTRCTRFSTDIQSCASMQKTRTSMLRKTRMCTAGL